MKILLFLTLLLTEAWALEVKFLGVSSMLISDGRDQLLFDAPFTRANPLHWLNLIPLKSNEKLVSGVLRHHRIENLKGIFVSHHHVDHAVDVGFIAQVTKAKAYGDQNLERLIPKEDRELHFQKMQEGEEIKIGDFGITPFKIPHGPIPMEFIFMGEVPADFNYSLYDYKEGSTWFYLITHGEKKILWNGSTGNAISKLMSLRPIGKIDLYVLGLGALSLKDQVSRLEGNHAFKTFIPVHFDNFFFPYDMNEFTFLPFSSIKEETEDLKKQYPKVDWILPELGQSYQI